MKLNLLCKTIRPLFIAASLLFLFNPAIAQTKTRVAGVANWNTNATWVKTLSGGVVCTLLGSAVIGLGTSFTTELLPGDVISTIDGRQIGTVSTIANNGFLNLTGNASVLLTLSTAFGVEKVPGLSDDVEIGNTSLNAVSVTLNTASAAINSLTFISDNQSNSLTHSGSNTLTVTNNVIINQPTGNSKTVEWEINNGTATVNGNINFTGINSTTSRVAMITIANGSLNANADLIFSGSTALTKIIDMSGGAGSINLKGALTVPNSAAKLMAGTAGSIFNYNGTSSQTINYFPSGKYYHLHINNTSSNGATLSAGISTTNVDGNLSVGNINAGSLFNSGNFAIDLNNSRTVTIAAGSTIKAGTSIISFGTGSPALSIYGTFKTANTNGFSGANNTSVNATNPPTFILGSASTIEYNATGNQVVTGRTDYANIAATGGGIKTTNGNITANNNLNIGTGTTFNASSFIHYMKGTVTSAGSFSAVTSTMNFCGSGAQTIPALTYFDLTTGNAGTKTAGGGFTVTGDLTIGGGTVFNAGAFNHNIAGNFINSGTFAAATSTFNFNGVTNQQTSGAAGFYNLTVNNGNELRIVSPITVNGTLTLTNGRFNINGRT